MKTANTFLEAEWDFMHEAKNGTEDMWWILEGQSYPRLRRQYGVAFSHYPQNRVIGYVQDVDEPVVIIESIGAIQPVILSWLPGGSGLYHDVYFGEDEEAVTNATTESPHIYCGRQPAEMTTYDPGTLGLSKTYYWRIDEVDIFDPNSLWKGNVWSFTTANFLVVDDFESYNDLDESHPDTNRIFQTWIAPSTPGNDGAMVGHPGVPFAEQTIVHSGSQSMPFYYDNTNDRVNSWIHFAASVLDWTANGADTLSLWFRGDADNGVDAFYIAVNGVRLFHPDPDAVVIDAWTQWLIPFSDLTAAGVNMQNVASLNIGVGDRTKPSQNARGILYIDDITVIKGMS
jgi:hypothetical protein